MNLFKSFYYHGCALLPMQFLKSMGPATTFLPYHHTVSSQPLPHIQHLYRYKNEVQFTRDLDFLLKYYKPVSVSQIIQTVKNDRKLPAQSFLLSFDDGFREVYEIVAPILEKKGVPAIFFINPSFIDNKELFYRCKISLLIDELLKNSGNSSFLQLFFDALVPGKQSLQGIISSLKKIDQANAAVLDSLAGKINFSFELFLQKQQPFLITEQLHSLHSRGFSIGAHSMNHPYYHLLSLTEQVEQTVASCNFVNELLGTKECCFSFPHSDKSLSRELLRELNNRAIPVLFGIQNQKEEISNNMLHRFNAERPDINLEVQLKGIIAMMWLRNITGRNKVNRN